MSSSSLGASRRASSRFSVRPQVVLAAVVVGVSLFFGGGTRPDLPSDLLIGLIGSVALIATLPLFFTHPDLKPGRLYASAAAALLAVPLIQLVPLPPVVWSHLPGHGEQAAAFRAAGRSLNWQPLSVAPSLTFAGLISLTAPIVAFLLVLQMTLRQRRGLVFALLAFGVLSVALGFMQVSQGENSPLRLYAITNPSEAVGFFANRNHLGALLYMLLPISAAVAIAAGADLGSAAQEKDTTTRALVMLALASGVFILLLLAQGVVRSRAGLVITGLSTVASFFLLASWHDRSTNWRSVRYLVAAAAIALVLIANFALFRLLERTDYEPVDAYRTAMNVTTWQVAKQFLPFGSGIGSFVPVYFSVEHLDDLSSEYVNRAHDDFLESLLESGVIAPIVVVAFVAWFAWRSWTIWRMPLSRYGMMDGLLARAATIALILPLVHSAFDYPLRTGALMALFAIFAAMLLPPVGPAAFETDDLVRKGRNSRRRRQAREIELNSPLRPPPLKPIVRGMPPKLQDLNPPPSEGPEGK